MQLLHTLVIAFTACTSMVICTTYSENILLRTALLSRDRYDPLIRPVNDSSETLVLNVEFNYSPSVQLDENLQVMSDSYWLRLTWTDQLLVWNPEDYSGVSILHLHHSSLWRPHLFQYSNVHDPSLSIPDDALVSVDHSGKVTLILNFNSKTRCFMDISKFPFDVQVCSFYIMNDFFNEKELCFEVTKFGPMKEPQSQWTVIQTNAEVGIKYRKSTFDFQLTLKRQPTFFIITIIVPLVATASLNPLVFLIPATSGEKVSVAVTILLSYTVFLNVISGILPETATSVSILSVYITALQVLSGIYTILCVIIVKIDDIGLENWFPDICGYFQLRTRRVSAQTSGVLSGKFVDVTASGKGDTATKLDKILFGLCSLLSIILTCWCFISISS
ncbi:hypothetical protein SNE40_001254 [Patella caerulea]|uniref:Uncharacterized protein n=1 Tax=Patella caerulea TaxID=87958 RepID=A0AAN8QHV3_PATCE